MTLRARLTLLYGALVLAALVAVGAGVGAVVHLDVVEDNARRAAAGLPPEGLDPNQQRLLWSLALGLPAVFALAGAGGFWIAGRALRPLGEIARVAGAISADDLSRRLQTGGDAEVAALASSLNALFGRLQASLEGARRFTADAAHELRTPLASVMGRLEVALRHPDRGGLEDAAGGALEDLARMKSLLEGLLLLARADAGQLARGAERVDLGALAARVVERDRAAAEERALTLDLDGGGVFARGDGRLLERAIGNLVDNAVRWGKSRVALRLEGDGARARISVEDDGPGISEPGRLFERFYRGDAARTRAGGFGLGLSIARNIVELHGGQLAYAPRDGGGSIFTVQLPSEP